MNAHHDKGGHDDNFVQVVVATTSGFYPDEGHDRVPIHQPLGVQLEKAKDTLKIADTSGWIVTVNGEKVDPTKSYTDNGLTGEFELDWGPDHGGGG